MAHQFDAPLSPARTIIANRILAHLSQPDLSVDERRIGAILNLFDWFVNEPDRNRQHEAEGEVSYVLHTYFTI
jgi:hypothetical protein